MLLKVLEKVCDMLFMSVIKFAVIKMLVFKTYRNPLVQRSPDNLSIITVTNVAKLVGEIYFVGVFIGSNLDKSMEQFKKFITSQFDTNQRLSKWKAKLVELDQKVQNVVNKVLPEQLPTK